MSSRPTIVKRLAELCALVEEELARISEPRRAQLRARLATPVLQELSWNYGEHDERHPCWIVGQDPVARLKLVYCDDGFGPAFPWGYVYEGDGMGMDSQWHSGLEDAAIEAGWLPAPPGYEVPGPRGRAVADNQPLAALCEGFRGRVADIDEVLRFIAYNERAVALDALVSRFIDADEPPRIQRSELEGLAALAESMGCRAQWVDLITCLDPEDRARLNPALLALARAHVAAELPANPVRRAWLERLRTLLSGDRSS